MFEIQLKLSPRKKFPECTLLVSLLSTSDRFYAIYLLVPRRPVDFVKGAQVVIQGAVNQQAVVLRLSRSDVVERRLCQHEILEYNSVCYEWFCIQKDQILDTGSKTA